MSGSSGALDSVVSTENGRSVLLPNEASLGHDLHHRNEGYARRASTATRSRAREPYGDKAISFFVSDVKESVVEQDEQIPR